MFSRLFRRLFAPAQCDEVRIEYCENCGYKALCNHLKKKIQERIQDIEVLEVASETPGIFEIRLIVEGKTLYVYSKSVDGRVHLGNI